MFVCLLVYSHYSCIQTLLNSIELVCVRANGPINERAKQILIFVALKLLEWFWRVEAQTG